MAFKTAEHLARAFVDATTRAAALKTYVQSVRNASAAGPISGNVIVELYLRLVADKARFDAIAATPGIGQYAKDQYNDDTYDVAAEFTAMVNAITAVGTWINTNFPKDAGGYILKDQLTASGVDVRTFSTASLATFRTQLDSLIATIQ